MQNLDTLLKKYYNKFSEPYKEDLKKPKNERIFKFEYLSPIYWLLFQQYKEYILSSKKHKPPLFASYYSQLPEDIRKILDE